MSATTAGPRHLVLWDVDGTLTSNNESDEALFVATLRSVVGPTLEIVHPYRHGKTDLGQVTEYLLANGGTSEQVPEGSGRLVELSREHFASPGERQALPGVAWMLEALRSAGHVNAILTGNGEERARLKLASAGLDHGLFDWTASFFGDAIESRPHLALRAAEYAAEHAMVPVIIGDTKGDAQAAEFAGIGFIGVATGVDGVAVLRRTTHLMVVEDLRSGAAEVLGRLTK